MLPHLPLFTEADTVGQQQLCQNVDDLIEIVLSIDTFLDNFQQLLGQSGMLQFWEQ